MAQILVVKLELSAPKTDIALVTYLLDVKSIKAPKRALNI